MARRLGIVLLVVGACARPPGGAAPPVRASAAATTPPPTNAAAVERATALIDALQSLDADGVPLPDLTRARRLAALGASPESLAALDALLTSAWLEAARALTGHRIVPSEVDSSWALEPEPFDARRALDEAMRADRLVAALAALRPPHPEYERLRAALRRYRTIAAARGWPVVPAGPPLESGAAGPRVATVRAVLATMGDLDSTRGAGDQGDRYDDTLAAAVQRFQRRHGLAPDGIVGEATRAALNTPVAQRVRQLELALERWRWLPRQLEPPYVMVNIPAFEMQLVDSAPAEPPRRVILGRPDWRTPLLRGDITHVVIAPPWGVPPEIARRELIPLLRADTGYAARAGILVYQDTGAEPAAVDPATVDWSAPDSVLPHRLVQLPGPLNPLGRVKLVFRNRFGVYLHDTPAFELFGEPERALSHGCVRVDGAFDLARRLLRDQPEWTAERLDTLAAAWTTRWIRLRRPVPVLLVYATAWVDAAGEVQFRDDLYGWDALLAAALEREGQRVSSRLP